MVCLPARSTLFPYTTLFRSGDVRRRRGRVGDGRAPESLRGVGRPSDAGPGQELVGRPAYPDRKSTRLNSSHTVISYAVFCLKKKKRIVLGSYNVERLNRGSR